MPLRILFEASDQRVSSVRTVFVSKVTMVTDKALTGGIKALLVFLVFHLAIILTQTWAFFDYDLMARNKLQEPRFLADEAVVQSNRAICAAHSLVMLPLSVLAIVGLLRHQFYGVICTWMLLGTALYWPVNFVASRFTYASAGIRHVEINGGDLGICVFVFLAACWGSWLLFRSPQLCGWWEADLSLLKKTDWDTKRSD